MRTLEICTQRIFNNLTKQNEKLGSDCVLNQSTTVSNVQNSVSKLQRPASRVQRPEPSVQGPVSRVQRPTLASRVQKFWYALHKGW